MIKIALLGSTGSIGRQVLKTVDRYPDRFKVVSLACEKNAELLSGQINRYRPETACIKDSEKAYKIREIPKETTLYTGENAYLHAISEDADIVFVAVSGFAGLAPTLRAIEMKKNVALANKESLVAGGEIVMSLAEKNGVKIIPVDSEHSAIFRCLNYDFKAKFRRLIITASGGAFRDLTKAETAKKTAAEALKHPNWNMGKKITIDCATLANKGLEVIEACRLYNAPLAKVKAVMHPESIVHSMVEFDDGAVMAQLGYPSMEVPIQLALTYPETAETDVPRLDFSAMTLNFGEIDTDKYPCFSLALKAFEAGDNYPCAMSAANEAAVGLYLEDKIGFYDIAAAIEYVLGKVERLKATEENLGYTDFAARAAVYQKFGR